jgi:hypothetical protein
MGWPQPFQMTRDKKIFAVIVLIVAVLTILVISFRAKPYEFIKKDTWTFMSDSHRFILRLDTSYMKVKPYDRGPFVNQIDIYSRSDSSKIQRISVEKNLGQIYFDSTVTFVIEDMNFDGYKDFRVLKYISILDTSIREYWYWSYNSYTEKFERDSRFDKFRSPVFDLDSKTITTNYKIAKGGSFNDILRCDAIYKVNNNHLTLVFEEVSTQDKDGDRDKLLYSRELIEGKLVKRMAK